MAPSPESSLRQTAIDPAEDDIVHDLWTGSSGSVDRRDPWALVVGRITLTSAGPPGGVDAVVMQLCVLCGSRGTGDAVLNMVLFMPLGMVLGVRWPVYVALVAALVMSTGHRSRLALHRWSLLQHRRHPLERLRRWTWAGHSAKSLAGPMCGP